MVGGRVDGAVVVRVGRTYLGIGGSASLAWAPDVAAGVCAIPFELIVGATSDSGRWNVWLTGTYVMPAFVEGSPTDWRVAAASVLTHGPYDGTRAMPRDRLTVLGAFDADLRTGDQRGGYVEAFSQFGVISGFTGSIAFEIFVVSAPSIHTDPFGAFRVGLRTEVDLSTFWPTNAVAPVSAALALGWVPVPALTIEGWGGVSSFAQPRGDLPQAGPFGGLRFTLRR